MSGVKPADVELAISLVEIIVRAKQQLAAVKARSPGSLEMVADSHAEAEVRAEAALAAKD